MCALQGRYFSAMSPLIVCDVDSAMYTAMRPPTEHAVFKFHTAASQASQGTDNRGAACHNPRNNGFVPVSPAWAGARSSAARQAQPPARRARPPQCPNPTAFPARRAPAPAPPRPPTPAAAPDLAPLLASQSRSLPLRHVQATSGCLRVVALSQQGLHALFHQAGAEPALMQLCSHARRCSALCERGRPHPSPEVAIDSLH